MLSAHQPLLCARHARGQVQECQLPLHRHARHVERAERLRSSRIALLHAYQRTAAAIQRRSHAPAAGGPHDKLRAACNHDAIGTGVEACAKHSRRHGALDACRLLGREQAVRGHFQKELSLHPPGATTAVSRQLQQAA